MITSAGDGAVDKVDGVRRGEEEDRDGGVNWAEGLKKKFSAAGVSRRMCRRKGSRDRRVSERAIDWW